MTEADPRPREGAPELRRQKLPLSFNPRPRKGATRKDYHESDKKPSVLSSNFVPEFRRNKMGLTFSIFRLKKYLFLEEKTFLRETGSIDELENQTPSSVGSWYCGGFASPRQSAIHQKWKTEMIRNNNTNSRGGSFTDTTIEAVWRKATPIPGRPGYAKDQCGATIYRHSHGKTTGSGWEVDHIKPVARDGSDALSNLQPLQWQNNRRKADQYPRWNCTVIR